MAAPAGNQFWKSRSKHGRDKTFLLPEDVEEAAFEYFEWCDSNPWFKHEAVKGGDLAGQTIAVPTARPYTQKGLQIFIGIDENTWSRMGKDDAYKDFWAIVELINQIIFTQKFEGAAVGVFNANIIARELGLADNTNSKNTNYNHSVLLTKDEMREITDALNNSI